jgi:hypothetical protein
LAGNSTFGLLFSEETIYFFFTKIIVKFIKKETYYNRIRVGEKGKKERNISCHPCRKWEYRNSCRRNNLDCWQHRREYGIRNNGLFFS